MTICELAEKIQNNKIHKGLVYYRYFIGLSSTQLMYMRF